MMPPAGVEMGAANGYMAIVCVMSALSMALLLAKESNKPA
jgi:hypothetical protein